MSAPIRVLLVDDSPLVRSLLRSVLSRHRDLVVVGEAADGVQATRLADELRPDVVTMDVLMPLMGGMEAIDAIMARSPTAIVVVADDRGDAHGLAMEALGHGAAEVFPKPRGGFDSRSADALAEVLRRAARARQGAPPAPRAAPRPPPLRRPRGAAQCIGIVGSTGGPRVLREVLAALPAGYACPIAIVQHTADGFIDAFTSWLDSITALDVVLGRDGARLRPGQVVIAPHGAHMEIDVGPRVALKHGGRIDGHLPSGTALLASLARSLGPRAVGVVLTGMGRDGASGLAQIAAAGGVAVVEDPLTATVGGMPREALECTRDPFVVKTHELTDALLGLVGQ